MERIYAIGDIHGQKAMLEEALSRIERDGGGRVVFLGDYVDRGPDSRGVIETLSQGQLEGRDWVFIKGNHDRMFEWFIEPGQPRIETHLLVGYHWFHKSIGGIETAASYGVTLPERVRQKQLAAQMREAVPEKHATFLRSLRLHHHEDGQFFVHAGIRPGVPLDRQDEEDLLWIRQEFHDHTGDYGVKVVHGHTPVRAPKHRPNRINLDTGAGMGRALTTAVFEGGAVFTLGARGRERLPMVPYPS